MSLVGVALLPTADLRRCAPPFNGIVGVDVAGIDSRRDDDEEDDDDEDDDNVGNGATSSPVPVFRNNAQF